MIKKYPNRRLYDSEQSRYITLADLGQMIKRGLPTKVDKSRGGDATAEVYAAMLVDLAQDGRIAAAVMLPLIRASLLNTGDKAADYGRMLGDLVLAGPVPAEQLLPLIHVALAARAGAFAGKIGRKFAEAIA